MKEPGKWVIGVLVPVSIALIAGFLGLFKDLWHPAPTDGRLLLANVSTLSLENFVKDHPANSRPSARHEASGSEASAVRCEIRQKR
jgi:hypothetical protein